MTSTTTAASLTASIERRRKDRGLSYEELAGLSLVPSSTLHRRLRTESLTLDDLFGIAAALETTAADLMAEAQAQSEAGAA